MDIEKLENWVKELPEAEKDLPYFKIDGKLVSPNKRLIMERAVKKGSRLYGPKEVTLSDVVEDDEVNIVKQRTDILVKNIRKYNKIMPSFGILGYAPIPISNIKQELDINSEVGLEWKKLQLNIIKRYLARLEE